MLLFQRFFKTALWITILFIMFYLAFKEYRLFSQTCWNADVCNFDFVCDDNGMCLGITSNAYRLVEPPCGQQGDWSNWDGDECGVLYPKRILTGCRLPSTQGCGGKRAWQDETCF